jgi:hypothetical protein
MLIGVLAQSIQNKQKSTRAVLQVNLMIQQHTNKIIKTMINHCQVLRELLRDRELLSMDIK